MKYSRGGGGAAADDDQPVEKRGGRGHRIACRAPQLFESLPGRRTVACEPAFGDLENLFGFEAVPRVARRFGVDPFHGTHRDALFDDHSGIASVAQAPRLGARVVARVQARPLADQSEAEARAEGVAQEVAVTLGAAGTTEPFVHLGQRSAERLPVGEQVAVVVDEDRQTEPILQIGTQRHAVAERGEVGQITADDPPRVVRRSGEGEADRCGPLAEAADDVGESFGEGRQTAVEVVRPGGQGEGLYDRSAGLHRPEYEVGASGIERDDDARVGVAAGYFVGSVHADKNS